MIKKIRTAVWIACCLLSLNSYGQVVISQIYGGGGNSGASLKNDFIELFNAGNQTVVVTGWSVQYASATGNSWQRTNLSGSIAPGQYYLIQQAQGAGGTVDLPTPNATGNIAMSGTAGKVALVSNQNTLTLSCPAENIIDFVGYGSTTNCSETAPTANLSNTTAAIRASNGCTDNNNNSTDFAIGAPAPRNSSTTANPCGSIGEQTNPAATASATPATVNTGQQVTFTLTVTPGTNPASTGITVDGNLTSIGGSATQPLFDDGTNGDAAAGDNIFSYEATISQNTSAGSKTITFSITDAQSRMATASANLTVQNPEAITAIYTIQGSSTASPLVGQTVTTEGVVTGDFQGSGQFNGFFIQDATGDGNPATSDGIFVASNTAVSIGQMVRVTGPVREPFTQTQIGGMANDNVTVVVQSGSGAAITPVNVSLPLSSVALFEQYEGMLVNFSQPLTVSQNFTLGRFGEVWLSADLEYPFDEADGRLYNPTNYIDPTDNLAYGVANATDNKAVVAIQQDLHNRSSILLDDASNVQNPAIIPFLGLDNTLRVGSTTSTLTGVLHYAFNAYRIQPTVTPVFSYAPRPQVPPTTGNANLKIASFNVLNYFNGNGTGQEGSAGGFPTPRGATNLTEFTRQRDKIITALKELNADIVGLIEMENDGDGETSAIADLVRGLNQATAAGTYDYIRDPGNAGTGTDQIKVAFIYKPGTVTPLGSPMADPDPVHNRPPLAQTFKVNGNGEVVTPVINHFKSKSGTGTGLNADQGDGQGNFNLDRVNQAKALVQFIKNTVIPTAKDQDVIILGDLNAYFEEDPIDVLRAAGFVSLFGPESYSYVFDKQSGSLDHALVTPGLEKQFTAGGNWHINADEPIFLDYNTEFKTPSQITNLYKPDPFRSSDHDPVLVGLRLFTPTVSFAEAAKTVSEGAGTYTINLTLSESTYQTTTLTIGVATQGASVADFSTTPAASENKIMLSLPAGSTSASFTLTILDDHLDELEEKITFTIEELSSGLKTGTSTATAISIDDNDVPVVMFAQNAATQDEGSSPYTVTVQTDIAPAVSLTIPVTISSAREVRYGDKRDYLTSPNGSTGTIPVMIPAGEMHGTFTVTPLADDDNEKNAESITFTLGSGNDYLLGSQPVFTFTILDVKKNTSLREMMISLWPNPTSGMVTIVSEMQNETMEATLRSPEGDVLYSGSGNAADLSRQISNALQSRRGGLYHLQLLIGDELINTRILKF